MQGVMAQRWHIEGLLGGQKGDGLLYVNMGDGPSERTGAVRGVCENRVRWRVSYTA